MLIALVAMLVQTRCVGWWVVAIGVVIGAVDRHLSPPQSQDDGDAADGRALQRRGRRRRGADFDARVSAYLRSGATALDAVVAVSLVLSAIIGSISFAGSIIAFLKLQEADDRPADHLSRPAGRQRARLARDRRAWRSGSSRRSACCRPGCFIALLAGALLLGVLFVLADRRRRHAGRHLAAQLVHRPRRRDHRLRARLNVLIICGALVGACGTLLTVAMGKAMNRSLTNVLFGAFGAARRYASRAASRRAAANPQRQRRRRRGRCSPTRSKVIFVPGYGMAVAQAQHSVKALADQLEKRGVEVMYAIHPVAGRMPGHMNVLLAEANVPYNQLLDMDDINPEFPTDRRGAGHRRQRRHESGRAQRGELADLRHADSRRRQGRTTSSCSSAR